MKKFITTIPRQPEKFLTDCIYEAANNPKYQTDVLTCFPVIPIIVSSCEENEKIGIYAVTTKDYSECLKNKVRFEKQLEELLGKKNISYTLEYIESPFSEDVGTHLNTFKSIISYISDNDVLFADITYGTKPTPIISLMALNYAVKLCKNSRVECVCYGEKDFLNDKCRLFDVTSLFTMNEIMNNMAKAGVKEPQKLIEMIIGDDNG